jgi:hypothetical protein
MGSVQVYLRANSPRLNHLIFNGTNLPALLWRAYPFGMLSVMSAT